MTDVEWRTESFLSSFPPETNIKTSSWNHEYLFWYFLMSLLVYNQDSLCQQHENNRNKLSGLPHPWNNKLNDTELSFLLFFSFFELRFFFIIHSWYQSIWNHFPIYLFIHLSRCWKWLSYLFTKAWKNMKQVGKSDEYSLQNEKAFFLYCYKICII